MKVLAFASAAEALTGVLLLVCPPIVVRLLLGADIAGAGSVAGRIAGISLISLGLACWPGREPARALCGMLTYSTLATLYLAYVGIAGETVGMLLWPAVVIHLILTGLLAREWSETRNNRK